MIKWSDIPTAAKLSSVVVVGVFSMMGYLTTYQSDAEAQQYQEQHQSELKSIRVQQIEETISNYRLQLLGKGLTEAQRDWIAQEIIKLTNLVKCIRDMKC